MADVITIILRAVRLASVSSAYLSQFPLLSATWQSVQFMPREAEKNPMVAMNWSAGIPLSAWTFLKTCSAIGGLCSGRAWPNAGRVLATSRASGPATRTRRVLPTYPPQENVYIVSWQHTHRERANQVC